ncbi:MAG: polymorphic toxin type 50 domain-containing protein [Chlamydiae bacterium]|nr:polymorphic toxin type 50 domain-containing protein [Chlamydiota bacterium]
MEKGRWSHPDPQQLLNKYAGKGQKVTGKAGKPGYRERVDFQEIIGYFMDKDSKIELPTSKGIIHYSKKGAHIVPADPR